MVTLIQTLNYQYSNKKYFKDKIDISKRFKTKITKRVPLMTLRTIGIIFFQYSSFFLENILAETETVYPTGSLGINQQVHR
jgi:hypothetical protein